MIWGWEGRGTGSPYEPAGTGGKVSGPIPEYHFNTRIKNDLMSPSLTRPLKDTIVVSYLFNFWMNSLTKVPLLRNIYKLVINIY